MDKSDEKLFRMEIDMANEMLFQNMKAAFKARSVRQMFYSIIAASAVVTEATKTYMRSKAVSRTKHAKT